MRSAQHEGLLQLTTNRQLAPACFEDRVQPPLGAAIVFFADRHDRRIKSPVSGMLDIGDYIRYFLILLFKMVDSSDKMELGNKLEVPHRRDRRKKSPGVSASIGGENRLRFSLTIKFAAIGV